jgi:hypothetical protein
MCTVVHLVSIIKGYLIQLAQFDIYQVSVGKLLRKILLDLVQQTETSVYFNAPPCVKTFGIFLCCVVMCCDGCRWAWSVTE